LRSIGFAGPRAEAGSLFDLILFELWDVLLGNISFTLSIIVNSADPIGDEQNLSADHHLFG
jgi:hypothetical protein